MIRRLKTLLHTNDDGGAKEGENDDHLSTAYCNYLL